MNQTKSIFPKNFEINSDLKESTNGEIKHNPGRRQQTEKQMSI
jgi:hypothetical protein